MLKVILAKSAPEAAKVISKSDKAWVAIETEYGDQTIGTDCPGVELALNHHGIHQKNAAPALAYQKNLSKRYDNFIISHIDLDVLFGILWSAGWLKKTDTTKGLANLVALADTNGFHTIRPLLDEMPSRISNRYYAIGYLLNSWVINDNGQLVKDISKEIHKLLLKIKDIIIDGATPEQIALFKQWFASQEEAAKNHLINIYPLCDNDNLFVFVAPFSLTTAYQVRDKNASIIVQYNEQSKSISLSCFNIKVAQKYFGKEGVLTPLRKYFGKDAGGKYTIGGTSRSHDTQPEMLQGFIDFLRREYLNIPEVIEIYKKQETTQATLGHSKKYPFQAIIKLLDEKIDR